MSFITAYDLPDLSDQDLRTFLGFAAIIDAEQRDIAVPVGQPIHDGPRTTGSLGELHFVRSFTLTFTAPSDQAVQILHAGVRARAGDHFALSVADRSAESSSTTLQVWVPSI